MRVRDVMTEDCQAIMASDSIVEAACLMRDLDVGILPIVDDEGILVGTLTDRDIVVRCLAEGFDEDAAVRSAMTRQVITCTPDEDLELAADLMKLNQIRRMIVTDGEGHVTGIVSLADISRHQETQPLSHEVLEEVSRPHLS